MGNQAPVLEWRAADAAQKLLKACEDLGLTLPEGDDLDVDSRRKWKFATAVGAVVTTDLDPDDPAELTLRSKGAATGAIAMAEFMTPADKKDFATFLFKSALEMLKG